MSFRITHLLLLLFFIFTGFIYLHNVTHDIYSGDNGDLVTAAYVFGVAHPPGYPLLSALGFLLSHLPIPLPVVAKVSLISVCSSLLGLFFFYKLSLRAAKSFFIALLSTTILAFSYLFWLYTEVPEVFALNTFFIIILFYFAVLFSETKRMRYLYLLTFFTGLALTNQHQILIIFPALFVLTCKNLLILLKKKRAIIYLLVFFFLGLLPYIYIPIAATHNPPINWDNASTVQNFFHLVFREDYVTFTRGSLTFFERTPILTVYLSTFLDNYSALVFIICLLGLIKLFLVSKLKFWTYSIGVLLSGPLLIFYMVPVITQADALGIIERFYIESFVIFLFFMPYGFLLIKNVSDLLLRRKAYAYVFLSVFFVVPFMMIQYNFPKTDLSQSSIGNTLGYQALSDLSPHAVIFPIGDTATFNSWYVHYVLGYRPDIDFINLNGAGNNPFRQHVIDEYRKMHQHSHKDENIIVQEELPHILTQRPVFSLYPLTFVPDNLTLIPRGLTFEVIRKDQIPTKEAYTTDITSSLKKYTVPKRSELPSYDDNIITPDITKYYSNAFVAIGQFYLIQYKDPKIARSYFQKAVEIDDENAIAYSNLGNVQTLLHERCSVSEGNVKKAIYYYPLYKTFYWKLYEIYTVCHESKKIFTPLLKQYNYYFHTNIEDDFKKMQKKRVNSS